MFFSTHIRCVLLFAQHYHRTLQEGYTCLVLYNMKLHVWMRTYLEAVC